MNNSLSELKDKEIINQKYDLVLYFHKPRSETWEKVKSLLMKGHFLFNEENKTYIAAFNLTEDNAFLLRNIWHYIRGWKTCSIFIKGLGVSDTESFMCWFDCYLQSFVNIEDIEFYCQRHIFDPRYPKNTPNELKGKIKIPCKCRYINFDFSYSKSSPESIKKQIFEYYMLCKANYCPLFNFSNYEEFHAGITNNFTKIS